MPASRIAGAVPPVESSSTPASRRPRAKSTTPVLSETEISARRTSAAIRSALRHPQWPRRRSTIRSRAHPARVYVLAQAHARQLYRIDQNDPRRGRIDPHRARRDQPHDLRQQACSVAWIVSSSSSRSRLGGTGTGRWRMIAPVSTPSSTKCTVTPVILHSLRERLADRVEAAKRRQQGRMDIDDPSLESPDEGRARAAACSRRARPAPPPHPPASRRSRRRAPRGRGTRSRGNARVAMPASLGPAQRSRLRLVGADGDHLDAVLAVHGVEDRLQVRPRSRGQAPRPARPPPPGSRHAASATSQLRELPSRRAQPARLDQRVDLASSSSLRQPSNSPYPGSSS